MSRPGVTRAVLEITAVVGLVFAIIWTVPRLSDDRVTVRRIGTGVAIVAATIGFGSAIMRGEKLIELGLSLRNFLRSAAGLAGPTLLVVAGLLLVGYWLDSWRFTEKVFRPRPIRWLWPIGQQYLVQSFLNRRLQDMTGRGWRSVLITALIFSLLHLPNPALMIATFLMGAFWAWSFQREPNLYALTLSHMILALVLKYSLPLTVLPNMRIGWAYWR